ncbi:hypothetical protein K458DRAFT_348661 [Lentithecium fluviatile CBS 122367]|uniref:Uncharacterized protein n=1 Tax=Lentithecium fluviatile CBS 122367 TaxID=1168545 RepID=A0A6G1IKL8_9PLEO|nr:hypothetical protein K458DRAFT_348661 [Lentithecium fluviatile CBS 122367]
MSSAQGQTGGSRGGPPYAPQNASLGGLPDTLPDIPATAVFLLLYVIFAATHMKILKMNKARGHKFNFSGALFGFCAIRVVTMSLRIAWARHARNVSLGIAAQVFVYVGTIILYIVNWFFAQRVVRAQHPRFGWSKPCRILFRAAIGCLILSLIMLVIGAIQQFFTQDANTLRIDRNLQLTGQTYFAVLCFAPIIVVLLSLIFPRRGTEKFGAGRLRNNITILLIATAILSAGQIFRAVSAWLPPTPLRNAQGQIIEPPWYYSKACFYTFNFTTEFLVILFYAIIRVDLRFHVPDGSNKPGDYSNKVKTLPKDRDSTYTIDVVGKEKNLKRISRGDSIRSIASNQTLHQYEHSLFEDTQTLADSLRYPSSVLEIDSKSGAWKVKRASRGTSISSIPHAGSMHSNASQSNLSQSSTWDSERHTWVDGDAPPIPSLPNPDWPLRESQLPRGQIPVMEHRNRPSRSLNTPDMEKGDAIEAAIAKLEANSESNPSSPPDYDAITVAKNDRQSTSYQRNWKQQYMADRRTSELLKKHVYSPSIATASSDLPDKHDYSPSSYATAHSDLPKKHDYAAAAETTSPPKSTHSETGTSMNTEEAEREFARFSYEAPPMERSLSETERYLERR